MRKMLVIAVRDYNAAVRTKAFLVSLVFLPVLMGGSLVGSAVLKDHKDARPKSFAIVDRTPEEGLYAALDKAAKQRTELPPFLLERVVPGPDTPEEIAKQRLEQSERVRQRDLHGFLDIGAGVGQLAGSQALPDATDDRFRCRYQSNSPLSRDFSDWATAEVNKAVQKSRAQQKGILIADVREVQQPVRLEARGLSKRDSGGAIIDGREVNFLASFLLPTVLVMLMFMMVFVGATPLLQGVLEEKMARISEVLLGSVRPFQMMMGKLLGTVGVAATLAAVYLGGSFAAAHYYGYGDLLTWQVIGWFLVFETLGVLMFGSLFIAVGAACTNAQEAQTMLMPVTLLAVLPMFVMVQVIREPDSSLATWFSLVPTATPMLMTARLAIPPGIPAWQPLLGVVLVLLTTLLCVYAAGRIFRVGILMQGKGASFGDLLRWIVRG